MKKCPHCAEEIQDTAKVCKHCGRDVEPAKAAPKQYSIFKFGCGGLLFILIAIFVIGALSGGGGPKAFTAEHSQAALQALAKQALTEPKSIQLDATGFIVAEYELSDSYARNLAVPLKSFGEQRLLAIREGLLPFGFKNYRVNINGTPPGTGLVKRYGSSRFTDSGKVEWLTP